MYLYEDRAENSKGPSKVPIYAQKLQGPGSVLLKVNVLLKVPQNPGGPLKSTDVHTYLLTD